METNRETEFYIDATPLETLSRRPFHLEKRLNSRPSSPDYENGVEGRRREFIESRRKKLQVHGKHVKKVLEKQKSSSDKSDKLKLEKIELGIKAAFEKRASILESQKSRCAKNVLRAKRVKIDQTKKLVKERELKMLKYKERQMFVAKRRQHFLSLPRSRLLDLQDWSIDELRDLQSTLNESAIVIQLWWRKCKILPKLKAFAKLNISFDIAKEMPFENLVVKMQEKAVIEAGTNLVNEIKKLQPTGDFSKWKNSSRVFLSAYMIASHPTEAMPHMGSEEEIIQKAAEEMVKDVETLIVNLQAQRISDNSLHLLSSLSNYYTSFEEWKRQDTRRIVDGMIAHWLELEKLWLSVRHTQLDAETNWHPKIAEQQKSIQLKLQRFGLGAVNKLKREIKKMRDELRADEDSESSASSNDDTAADDSETGGNSSSSEMPFSTSPQRFPTGAFMKSRDSITLTRRSSSQMSSHSAPSASTSPISFEKIEPKIISPVIPITNNITPISPEKIQKQFGSFLSNERLAHELVRDPDFEMKSVKKSKLEEQVGNMAKKAFFDAAREQFSQGVFINFVPTLLEDIKKQLLSMLSENGKIANEINDLLDIELIHQQIKNNAFDAIAVKNYVISKLAQLCAPIRDQACRNLQTVDDLADLFQQTLELLDLMKLDLLNYKLKSLAPILKPQAIEYEKEKFKESFGEASVENLKNTEAWLQTAFVKLDSVAKARNPEGVQHPDNQIRFEDIFNEAMIGLLFSSTPTSTEKLPETLILDQEYIFKLQNEVQLLTIISALVMLSKNAVAELRRDKAASQKLRDRLFDMLKPHEDEDSHESVTIDNLAEEIIRACNEALVGCGKPALPEENATMIKNVVDRTISTKDKLYSLISRRVQSLIMGQLKSGGEFKATTGMSLNSAGLDIVEKELKEVSRKIYLLASHNKDVHAEWYDEILKNVVA